MVTWVVRKVSGVSPELIYDTNWVMRSEKNKVYAYGNGKYFLASQIQNYRGGSVACVPESKWHQKAPPHKLQMSSLGNRTVTAHYFGQLWVCKGGILGQIWD